MDIVAVQFDIAWEDKAASHRRVEALLAEAKIAPGSLLVLPEMFATGYSMDVPAIHEGEDRPSEHFLAALAQRYQSTVLGGVVRLDPSGKGRNEAVAFGPNGAELVRYAKRYPMTIAGEADHYVAGDRAAMFDWGGCRVSPLICYDLRFPEAFRDATRQGAEVLAVIANFPAVRREHWVALLQARAIENQAYVVGVNRCGRDPNHDYAGQSMIVDPKGHTLAIAGDRPIVLTATVDIEALRDYRRAFPALKDRRGI